MKKVENWTVTNVMAKIAGARQTLYERGISANNNYTLANVAEATGNNTNELLAVMHYRMRRAAANAPVTEPVAEFVEDEAELVA